MRCQRLMAAGITGAAVIAFAVTLTGAVAPASASTNPVLYVASTTETTVGLAINRFDLTAHATSVVLPNTPGRFYRHPVLSPDGRQMVVQRSFTDTAGTDLLVLNVDGTQLHQLSPVRFAGDVRTVWSPNGAWIAYSGSFGGASHLLLSSPDGGALRDLGYGEDPAYSPDGLLIAFGRSGRLMVANWDGSDEQQLAGGAQPAWSPDGTKIAYTAGDGVHVMDANGSNDTWLSPGSRPVWSPDGSRLVVSRETAGLHLGAPNDCGRSADPDEVNECLGTVSATGGDAQEIAGSECDLVEGADQVPIVDARWSADGATIYFSLQTMGTFEVPAAGGARNWTTNGVDPVLGVAQVVVPTSVTLTALRPTVYWDLHDAFSGTLTNSSAEPIPAATVDLQRRRLDGSGWVTIASMQTDSAGAYRFVLRLHYNADYRARFAAPFYVTSTSRSVHVNVRTLMYASTPQPWRVHVDHYTRFAGDVTPSHAGHSVYLQLWRAGAWHTIASQVLSASPVTPDTNTSSLFSFRIRGSSVGNWHYRVLIKADRLHAGNWKASWLQVFTG